MRLLAALVAVLVLAAGCRAEPAPDSRPSLAATPSAPSAPSAAGRVLEALQTSVADLRAIEVSGGAVGHAEVGRRRGSADLRTHEFRAVLGLGNGQVLEMLRKADLTWTKAPASYWVRLGYTRASARAAQGKWVVANATAVEQLVGALDPGALITSLLGLKNDQVDRVEPVLHGDLSGNRVLVFHQAGGDQLVYVTPGPRPRLLRLTSTANGVTTTVDVTARRTPFRVRLPEADQVFQP